MTGRPVPWASWGEWLALRDDLWSTDPQRQEGGLQQVCAWRLRGKLPLGVDATAHLLDARRADAEWQRALAWAADAGPAAQPSLPICGSMADAAVAAGELPLRLRYSLPLIRLVNGISDSQQRGRVASSVAVLSDAAGLPRALVDVRHDATHNELPSLPLLRAAADSALAWLWDNYWDGQRSALSASAERISSLLACLANSWRAATAAGLSGSAGALAAAAEEDGDDGEPDGDAAGGYSGSEGQRARRQAMSELRSMVPNAFTHELLQPILDCPALQPPELAPAPTHAPQQPAAQAQREAVEVKAWRSTMKQLLKWYPRLRPLLLQAALRRLAAPPQPLLALEGPGEADSDADRRARSCALWVMRLLPAAAAAQAAPPAGQATPGRKNVYKRSATTTPGGANPKGGEDSGDGGGGSGSDALLDAPLTNQQLQALLSIATTATSAPASSEQLQPASGNVPRPADGDERADAVKTRSRLLGEVATALQAALAHAEVGADRAAAKRRRLAAVATPIDPVPNDPGDVAAGSSVVGFLGAAGTDGAAQDAAGSEPPALPPPLQDAVAGQGAQQRRRRWQRCADWSKCAIGCLPCPLTPNGRIPLLVPLAPTAAAGTSTDVAMALGPDTRLGASALATSDLPCNRVVEEGGEGHPRAAIHTQATGKEQCAGTSMRNDGNSVDGQEYYIESEDDDQMDGQPPDGRIEGALGDADGGSGGAQAGGRGWAGTRGVDEGGAGCTEEDAPGAELAVGNSLFGALLRRQGGVDGGGGVAPIGFLL